MLDKKTHTKVHYYIALLIAFSLPFARVTPFFIALMLINWLVEADFKYKFETLIKNKFTFLFVSLYIVHLIGLIYTENKSSGEFDLQVKLSLIIFPILLGSRPFSGKKKDKIFYALIAGSALSAIILIIRAVYLYFSLGENNFFYETFSYFLHPSYFSMYLNVAIGWLLINILQNGFKGKSFTAFYALITIVFFSVIIVMLSSKMGIITMVLMYITFLLIYIITKRKYVLGIIGLLSIGLLIAGVITYVPEIKGRMDRALNAVTSSSVNSSNAESTAVRMLIWSAANQVIADNLILGTGTGDAKDELMKVYEDRGMTGAIEHDLNAHNEFYQIFIALGVAGFILLLANFYFPLFYSFKTGNSVYLIFLFVTFLNFIPESMLETQAGVMFYAFFNSLLCFHPSGNSES